MVLFNSLIPQLVWGRKQWSVEVWGGRTCSARREVQHSPKAPPASARRTTGCVFHLL